MAAESRTQEQERWDRPVTVGLTPTQVAELERLARERFVSTASLVRAAVARFLDDSR